MSKSNHQTRVIKTISVGYLFFVLSIYVNMFKVLYETRKESIRLNKKTEEYAKTIKRQEEMKERLQNIEEKFHVQPPQIHNNLSDNFFRLHSKNKYTDFENNEASE